MPARESRGRGSRAVEFLWVEKHLAFNNGGFELKTNDPQDWDISRLYQGLASSDGVMTYSDGHIPMAKFCRDQHRLLDRLEKLLQSLPDDSN